MADMLQKILLQLSANTNKSGGENGNGGERTGGGNSDPQKVKGKMAWKKIAPADGAFYVYVDLGKNNTAPGLGSAALCSDLLELEGVAFTPGIDFEDPSNGMGDRRFRISYAGGVETAREAMERFIGFWPSWQKKIKEARAL